MKFAHVFPTVPAVGHAEAVRDVVQTLQKQKLEAEEAAAPALAVPPPKPTRVEEAAAAAPAALQAVEEEKANVDTGGAGGGVQALNTPPVLRVQEASADKQMDEEQAFPLAEVESVGPLIGRGGTRVKQLAVMSGASIRFENEPKPTMFAKGSPEQRAKAFKIVSEWISSSGADVVPLALELHGRVIGTGGAKIREIELATNAHVLFEKEPEPRMVVRGNETERAAAMGMVQAIIESLDYEEEKMALVDVKDRTHVRAVLGVKGANVQNVEMACGVKIRYNLKEEDENKFFIIIGNSTGRAAAKAMIEEHLQNIKEMSTHQLLDDELRSLMGYKGQVVHRLEAESGGIISMQKEEDSRSTMIIRGTAAQRAKAWELAQDVLLNDAVETHEIPTQLRRIVVGPNGTVVKRVEADTGASVTLLNDNADNTSRLLLRGNQENRSAAWKLLESIIYSEVGEEKVMVPRRLVGDLLRNRARRCKDLELASGTYITIDKEEGTQNPKANDEGMVQVSVRGLAEQREVVKALINDMDAAGPEKFLLSELAEPGAEVSILDVRRIIGPRGRRVAELEEDTGASIRLEVEPELVVSVMGTREQKDAALALIRQSLTCDDQELVPLEENQHGVVIGVNGRSVQMIERESGAQVSFKSGEDAAMVLRGSEEQRAVAKKLVQQVLKSEIAESLLVDEAQASALIGLKGRNIRQVERVSGARVQVVNKAFPKGVGVQPGRLGSGNLDAEIAALNANETLVIIKGTEEQRAKARELVMVSVEPSAADEEMRLTPEQVDRLLELRGSVRRDIEERTGARLSLLDSSLIVFGKSGQREAARVALEEEFAKEEESRELGGGFPLLMLRLIIGVGGANVRKLEEASGARIRFDTLDQSRDPASSVSLKVRGTAEQRAKGFALIEQEQALYEEERMALDANKHYLLIGRSGDIVKALELQTGTAICFTQSPEPAMVVLGRPDNRRAAIEEARARVAGNPTAAQNIFRVPKEYHADVIGARGRNVQRIERLSGALVHFKGFDSDDCVVTGTPDQQQKAWEMIQETLDLAQGENECSVAALVAMYLYVYMPMYV